MSKKLFVGNLSFQTPTPRRRWRIRRGGAKNAFWILLSDKNVKAVLINIFGGIIQCDIVFSVFSQRRR